jgi:hemerythrin
MLTFQALKEWLNKHIIDSDRRLAEALVASNEMQYQPEQGAAS